MLLFHNLALPLALDPRCFKVLALLCPVLPADAGLLDTLAQRHGFVECNLLRRTDHRLAPGRTHICFVHAKMTH